MRHLREPSASEADNAKSAHFFRPAPGSAQKFAALASSARSQLWTRRSELGPQRLKKLERVFICIMNRDAHAVANPDIGSGL